MIILFSPKVLVAAQWSILGGGGLVLRLLDETGVWLSGRQAGWRNGKGGGKVEGGALFLLVWLSFFDMCGRGQSNPGGNDICQCKGPKFHISNRTPKFAIWLVCIQPHVFEVLPTLGRQGWFMAHHFSPLDPTKRWHCHARVHEPRTDVGNGHQSLSAAVRYRRNKNCEAN